MSRAQRQESLISIRNAFGFKAVNSFNGTSMKEFDAEGASAKRVPFVAAGSLASEDNPGNASPAGPSGQPLPETRECEGCGLYKPIEEMETVRHPVFGETYQCEQCRGGP